LKLHITLFGRQCYDFWFCSVRESATPKRAALTTGTPCPSSIGGAEWLFSPGGRINDHLDTPPTLVAAISNRAEKMFSAEHLSKRCGTF
jgi:hypothetical protein